MIIFNKDIKTVRATLNFEADNCGITEADLRQIFGDNYQLLNEEELFAAASKRGYDCDFAEQSFEGLFENYKEKISQNSIFQC